jgi:hypothetical protein
LVYRDPDLICNFNGYDMTLSRRSILGVALAAAGAVTARILTSGGPSLSDDTLSEKDAMAALHNVDPTEAPTSGTPVSINGEPYLITIEPVDPSKPPDDRCNEITFWPDRQNPADEGKLPKPAYKTIVCG